MMIPSCPLTCFLIMMIMMEVGFFLMIFLFLQNGAGRGASGAGDLMNYGVTIPPAADSQQLQVFDTLLERYSFFSSPTLVHGDKQKEDMQQHSGRRPSAARSRSANFGGMVVPPGVVAGNGQQVGIQFNQALKTPLFSQDSFCV